MELVQLVTKDISHTIMGGVPAKIIKKRFDNEIIENLLALKWWELDPMELKKLEKYSIKEFIEKLQMNSIKIFPKQYIRLSVGF